MDFVFTAVNLADHHSTPSLRDTCHALGGSDTTTKLGTCHGVVGCYGTPNPKCDFDLLLFHLAHARPHKESENFACNPKTSKKKFYLTFLNVSSDTNFFSNDNFAARVPRGREKKFADFFKLNS